MANRSGCLLSLIDIQGLGDRHTRRHEGFVILKPEHRFVLAPELRNKTLDTSEAIREWAQHGTCESNNGATCSQQQTAFSRIYLPFSRLLSC